jgi:GDPmannose 4,6-dehydratase
MNYQNNHKVAFVFGVTGQIGSYLAEYLLELGYQKVIGVARRVSTNNLERLGFCLNYQNFILESADITCPFSLTKMFSKYIGTNREHEVYNLAAASHVHTSFNQPKLYSDITGVGHLNLLETLLQYHKDDYIIRLYFQSSSEVFGSQRDEDGFQSSTTRMIPNSPYAAAKLYAFNMNKIYRESYGMWNSAGIIFNTESPRRGEDFVTRKITKWFAEFAANNYVLKNKLQLGNVNSLRDWTHAKDSVRAIHLINTAQSPKDYVVASGQANSVYDFMKCCYNEMELAVGKKCSIPLDELFEVNQTFFRPNEVPYLKGKADVIFNELGWKPDIKFSHLVHEMFYSDYTLVKERI